MPSADYAPISDYALIGDCHGAALVCKSGSIDWCCLRRFDTGAVFARLLDAHKGGSFSLVARDLVRVERRYLPDTAVLETTFITRTGTARLLDAFAMRRGGRTHPYRQLLRLVEGLRGEVAFAVTIAPRFDYGSLHPWLRFHAAEGVYTAIGGDDGIVLSTDCPLEQDLEAVAWRCELAVSPRQKRRFAITFANPFDLALKRLSARTFDTRLRGTKDWWRVWSGRGQYEGPWQKQMARSAVTLKLLTCAPTGAIIAAPTTSLPESIGGERNWDYRYSWVRDAAMTLQALCVVGHREVATGFKRFIEVATAGRAEELQIMYGCYGERRLSEQTLPYLDGYRGSRPVRVGNGAALQSQLDVYGELLDAAHLWRHAGNPITPDTWRFLRGVTDLACRRWSEPDRGLWEVRGAPRHFVYSKAMCWLALDRAVKNVHDDPSLPCDIERWRSTRDEIRISIETHGIDPERGCFVQSYGSKELDASLLRLPLIGFVDANDPRMLATVEAVRKDLAVGDLLRRYRPERSRDGLAGGEGMFLMASFWLVDVLTMQGKIEEAEAMFERLLSLGNDLGLFSEEYDAVTRSALGNFPQAFTHVALIIAAEQIHRYRAHGSSNRCVSERAEASLVNRPPQPSPNSLH